MLPQAPIETRDQTDCLMEILEVFVLFVFKVARAMITETIHELAVTYHLGRM